MICSSLKRRFFFVNLLGRRTAQLKSQDFSGEKVSWAVFGGLDGVFQGLSGVLDIAANSFGGFAGCEGQDGCKNKC